MASVLKICFQSILKLVNSIIGMVGMAMIIYAAWMIMVWHRHTGQLPFDHNSPVPWFIYATLGVGSSLCLISVAGHIAAETANGHCLACYMVLIFVLTLLEAAVTADVYLNRDWEADFPKDPSGKFDDLKHFVKSNFDFCKRIGLAIVAVQGLSILFSIILRALGPDYGQYSDSDDEYAPARLPLIRNQVPPQSYVVGEPHITPKNDNWNIRIHDKTNR